MDDPATDLAVTKTGPDQAATNSNLTYQITVTNNGPDSADNATLIDTFPAGLTFVSLVSPSGWSCSTPGPGSTGSITCTTPSLSVTAANQIFTLVAHTDSAVVPGSFISNKATVTTSTFDINDENNESTASAQIAGGSATDVGVTMVADKESALAGDGVTYAITVTNTATADSVSLSDAIPSGMTFVAVTFPSGWNCIHPSPGSGGNLSCSIGTLAPTAGQIFNLAVNIPVNTSADVVFTNSAAVTTTTADTNPENDSATTATTVAANYVVSPTTGSGQSAAINNPFALQLQATVRLAGIPKSGVTVNFQAPGSGASGTFAGNDTSAVSATSDENGVATCTVFTANGLAGGPYNVTASAGSGSAATFSLTNTKGNQTITFPAAPAKTYGDLPFALIATSSSNLPVAFNLVSGPGTISGTTLTIGSPGIITVRATQQGDSNYNPAVPINQLFPVSKATPSASVTSSKSPSDFGESVTFTVTIAPAPNTTGPTGSVQFKDATNNLGSSVSCIVGGGVCTAQISTLSLASGTHLISAVYNGDINFTTTSGTLASEQAVNSQPSISINDVSLAEGNSGITRFDFTVTLSAISSLPVRVDYATANGTATLLNNDYVRSSGSVIFNPGDRNKTITVLVSGDLNRETDETVFVNLRNPTNASISRTQGIGTIINDDTLDPPQLILDDSGPSTNQAAALDSVLFLRDPFLVRSPFDWLAFGTDRNTRVILFATNLQLNAGETAEAVVVNIISSNGQSYDVPATDLRLVSGFNFAQVVFRLPNTLVPGDALVTLKAHGQFSNSATISIRQ